MASAPNTGYFATLLKNKPPWGIYSAEAYTVESTTLFDLTGNGNDATISGNLPYVRTWNIFATGYGATGNIKYLEGNTGTFIDWPSGSIPPNEFTICSITRYSGATRGRILTSKVIETYNLLHGHWKDGNGSYRGAIYYASWLSKYTQNYGTVDDWLVCCGHGSRNGTTSVPYSAIVDGKFVGIDEYSAGANGVGIITTNPYTLCINKQNPFNGANEHSDFQFSQLIIWNQALTPDEMMCVSNVFNQYLDDGVYISALTRVPLYNLIADKPPWGMYSAFFSANNTLSDLTGNGRHATISGTGMTYYWGSGNGAASNVNMIYGSTTSNIEWPAGSLPANFTICSLTRYNGATRQRILCGKTKNVFHGHDLDRRGLAYYDRNITLEQNSGTTSNWLIMCVSSSETQPVNISPTNVLIDNGIAIGTNPVNPIGLPNTLVINGTNATSSKSDFAFSELFIWDRELTTSEMRVVANNLQQYLNTGTDFAPDYIFNKFVSNNGFGFPLFFELPPYNMSVPTNYIAYEFDAGNRALSYGQGCVIDTGFKVKGVDFGEIFQSDIVSNAVYTVSGGTNSTYLQSSLPLWTTSPSNGQPAMTVYFYSSLYVTTSSYSYTIRLLTNNSATVTVVNGNTTTATYTPPISPGSVTFSNNYTMTPGLNVFEIAATNTAGGTAYVNMSIYNNSSTFVYGTNTPWTTSRYRKLVISTGLKWYTYTFLSGSTKYIAYAFYAGTGTVRFRGSDQSMLWLVLGGGGGGGAGSTSAAGSGGGGGGFAFGTSIMTGNLDYTVTVGSGGSGGLSPTAGGTSQFSGASSTGGNPGQSGSAVSGGAGGVGRDSVNIFYGGTGGASGSSGGAAGGNGSFSTEFPTSPTHPATITFTTGSVTYIGGCGGGGGGAYVNTTASLGGNYGGGPGGSYNSSGKPGIVNIGGGGGGGGRVTSSTSNGGEGGDGVVILYYTYV